MIFTVNLFNSTVVQVNISSSTVPQPNNSMKTPNFINRSNKALILSFTTNISAQFFTRSVNFFCPAPRSSRKSRNRCRSRNSKDHNIYHVLLLLF